MPQTGYGSYSTTNFTSNVSISDNLFVGGVANFNGSALSIGGSLVVYGTAAFSNVVSFQSDISAIASRATFLTVTALSQMSAPVFRALAGSAVSPGIQLGSNLSIGFYNISATTIGFLGGIDFRTNSNILSMKTLANDSGRTIGELSLVFANSGMSLMYSSGKTTYTIGASAVSAAQA